MFGHFIILLIENIIDSHFNRVQTTIVHVILNHFLIVLDYFCDALIYSFEVKVSLLAADNNEPKPMETNNVTEFSCDSFEAYVFA